MDHLLSIILISLGAAAASALALPFVEVPQAAAWPWLIVSVILHVGYKLFLVKAYRAGDLGQVYAIARGTAPLLVALSMAMLFSEKLDAMTILGIFLLVTGVWLMCVRGGRTHDRLQGKAVFFALVTSAFICSYTIADGVGARSNGSAHGYAVWMFVIDGCLMLLIFLGLHRKNSLGILKKTWRVTAGGGAMMACSYWIAIWAMTQAPIAVVSALRESSVLFATLISVFILKEPLTRWRAASAGAIVAGILVMRLA